VRTRLLSMCPVDPVFSHSSLGFRGEKKKREGRKKRGEKKRIATPHQGWLLLSPHPREKKKGKGEKERNCEHQSSLSLKKEKKEKKKEKGGKEARDSGPQGVTRW